MPETHTVRPGQVYESCDPWYDTAAIPRPRIRVVGDPTNIPGIWGYGKVDIVTLTASGRELRPRRIEASQLHASGTTKHGQARRTGYRLIQEAPDA